MSSGRRSARQPGSNATFADGRARRNLLIQLTQLAQGRGRVAMQNFVLQLSLKMQSSTMCNQLQSRRLQNLHSCRRKRLLLCLSLTARPRRQSEIARVAGFTFVASRPNVGCRSAGFQRNTSCQTSERLTTFRSCEISLTCRQVKRLAQLG